MLGDHHNSNPQHLAEEQVRDYFLYLRQVKDYQASTMNQAKVALRTFYNGHLKKQPAWTVFNDVVVRYTEKLPVVISREEVALLLRQVNYIRFRVYFTLVYSCGLRLSEALAIEVKDIHAKSNRLHVRMGKGGKDRFVPICDGMISQLRHYWAWHQNPKLLFPGVGRRWRTSKSKTGTNDTELQRQAMHDAVKPMSRSSVHNAMKWAVARARFEKRVSVHTLRHCYATHLLEDGISLRLISAYLGHASLNQTLVYAHLTTVSEEKVCSKLQGLIRDVGRGK